MIEPTVIRSENGPVLELVLNRPKKLNALTHEIFAAIRDAVRDLRLRPDLRVLLIRATGRYFCAGVDLTQPGGDVDFGGSAMRARDWMRVELGDGMQTLYREMEQVEKPIVVAHHATCVGGGLELSLSCDFRLAARSAEYWFPEMQLGMLPLSGGLSRLTRLCGPHWVKWMTIANEKVSAEKALTMGLVHEVYPDETFEDEVRGFCERLASKPPEAVAAGKLAAELMADLPSDQARQLERLVYSSLVLLEERQTLREAVLARLRS